MRRHYPNARGAAPQIAQEVFPALVASSPTQSARGGGHAAKGRPIGGSQVGGSQICDD